MAEHRRASTVCARALEETPPRTALWDARPAPPLPPPPAAPTTPRQHPDESEDEFRARLETVLELRDRLETDDRLNLACEWAKRGVKVAALSCDECASHHAWIKDVIAANGLANICPPPRAREVHAYAASNPPSSRRAARLQPRRLLAVRG